jgi:type 1 fimbriae regulatory protein FimB/type 1 fimbriae regulatory protein FimE
METKDLASTRQPVTADSGNRAVRKRTLLQRRKNTDYRGREHLEESEVAAMVRAAAKHGRYGQRDAAAILLAYRHGFRVSEVCALRWDQVDLKGKNLYTNRAKGGLAAMHPLQPDEVKALKALAAQRSSEAAHVFENERGGPLNSSGMRKIVRRAGELAGLELPVHPHMLRHAAGFALMSKRRDLRTIQEWLGHKSLASTERYTALMPDRFAGIWD